jgi:hypothetical protein
MLHIAHRVSALPASFGVAYREVDEVSVMAVALRALLAAALVVAAACGTTPSAASPTPASTPTATAAPAATAVTALAPDAAAEFLRKSMTGTRPLLIPNTIPDTWRADVKVESAGTFTATYRAPAGAKTFTLMVAAANPPLPTSTTIQSHPAFHGDATALYQIANGADPTSDRFLMWIETGVWPGWPRAGVPYLVSTTGIGEAEFWQLTNGLHPDQLGG